MPLPCEFAVKSVVPAMRALVTRELSHVYNMKQEKIATLLEVTQSAVSQYLSSLRGRAIEVEGIKEVQYIVKTLANGLANRSLSRRQTTQKYCEACQIIRKQRVLCELHKKLDPTFNVEGCDACIFSTNVV